MGRRRKTEVKLGEGGERAVRKGESRLKSWCRCEAIPGKRSGEGRRSPIASRRGTPPLVE